MSWEIIERLARFFHEKFALDHDSKEWSEWPKRGCQVCISAAHDFLPILADERERWHKIFRDYPALAGNGMEPEEIRKNMSDFLNTVDEATRKDERERVKKELNSESRAATRIMQTIQKLDLTAPDTDEVSFVCTHCNNAGPLSECLGKQYERITGPRCPRCDYCVQVLRKPKLTAPSSTEEGDSSAK